MRGRWFRHARWAATLAAYNYVIRYRKGSSNAKPDALSWRPDYHPPPLPSLPILTPAVVPSVLPIPYLRVATVTLLPADPLLPVIVAAQAADAGTSALILQL